MVEDEPTRTCRYWSSKTRGKPSKDVEDISGITGGIGVFGRTICAYQTEGLREGPKDEQSRMRTETLPN